MNEANEVPIVELLGVIPQGSRILIESEGRSSTNVPVYVMAQRAIKHINELTARAEAAEAELEKTRMQLAACGVVAMANTRETATKARDMHPDYWCASVSDVADAVDREMAAREKAEAAEADARRYRWLRRYDGQAIFDTNYEAGIDAAIDAELAKETK